ncbi:hypothetical protein [uncultured Dysgonomonas sp.]|uniref:hypothetical protein n=1 Tax=uncultured Dysgonomonas sp. TaxID=206096 RepID=UPI0025E07CCA|nr:hypothetical protein [uncultured Dysgonomonas sp.]
MEYVVVIPACAPSCNSISGNLALDGYNSILYIEAYTEIISCFSEKPALTVSRKLYTKDDCQNNKSEQYRG